METAVKQYSDMDEVPQLILPGENTLLDVLVQNQRGAENPKEGHKVFPSKDRSLLVTGSRCSGKTTFIVEVFDLEEEIAPTVALEYFFSVEVIEYEHRMCNIWELGGGTTFSPTLYAIESMPQLTAIAFFDLSTPPMLWESSVSIIEVLKGFSEKRAKKDGEEMTKISDSDKEDGVTPFPMPLVIVGSKYDLFKRLEPETKKLICCFLRYLAHVHCASLFFYDRTNKATAKKFFGEYAFGKSARPELELDPSKPLCIKAGQDTFEAIQQSWKSSQPEPLSMEKFKDLLQKRFPLNESDKPKKPVNPLHDPNFKELKIDRMRADKDEHLDRLAQELEATMTCFEKMHW